MGAPRRKKATVVPPDLQEPVEAFLAYLSLERGLAKLTVAAYEDDLARFAAHCARLGKERWTDVGLAEVESWVKSLDRRGHAAASLARRLSAVRTFAAHLVRSGLRRDDFTELARGPKFRRTLPGTLTAEQAAKVVSAPDTSTPQGLRDRAMLELMYGSGLRISELCAVELQALDLESALVRVRGKGSKDRIVPVGETAITALRTYLEKGRPALTRPKTGSAVFLSARGQALSRKTFWLSVKQAAARSGIEVPVKPHLLRHAFATHLLAGGADLRSIQEMLGHADIATTQVYTSVERTALSDAHRRHHPRGRKPGA
jgi:integrase/recombinase XerD